MKKKVAVVLLNLGGPDSLKAVGPFLFNLFHDPAILRISQPFRWLLAHLISRCRTKKAMAIYQKMGGKSPLLEHTQAQALALEQALQSHKTSVYRVFIAMRYWHPFTAETIHQVQQFDPDQVVLLPLYPQFSTTTTASSFKEWQQGCTQKNFKVPTQNVCCYFDDQDFIRAHSMILLPFYHQAKEYGQPRLLFSAHSLPQKVVDAGDPYQKHLEHSVQKIVSYLKEVLGHPIDYEIGYQSRVGPLSWLTPSTEDCLTKAGKEGVPVVVIPIAFVSEHSETLVELDEDYYEYSKKVGIPFYGRVPALGCHPFFIQSLVNQVLNQAPSYCCLGTQNPCPKMLARF